MSILKIINTCSFPAFAQKNRAKEYDSNKPFANGTSTIFTIDDRHPVPLVSLHYEVIDESDYFNFADEALGSITDFGEMKITKKENVVKDKNEFFIDFIVDNGERDTTDNDVYAIIAVPTCGYLKNLKVSASCDSIELLRSRTARYGKQDVNVKINKNGELADGTWGFDKVLYLMVKLDVTDTDIKDVTMHINTIVEHCGKFENGAASCTTRAYDYDIKLYDGNSTIVVSYVEKRTVTEKPVALKIDDNLTEVNPYKKKPDKVRSASNERFANKPRWKNDKKPNDKKLEIPAPPSFDYNDKQKNDRRRRNKKKKSRNNYDY